MEYDNETHLMCKGKSVNFQKKSFLTVPEIKTPYSPNTVRKSRNNTPRTPSVAALETPAERSANNGEFENISLPPINVKGALASSQITSKRRRKAERISKRKRKKHLSDPELWPNVKETRSNSPARIGPSKQFKLDPLDIARMNIGRETSRAFTFSYLDKM